MSASGLISTGLNYTKLYYIGLYSQENYFIKLAVFLKSIDHILDLARNYDVNCVYMINNLICSNCSFK